MRNKEKGLRCKGISLPKNYRQDQDSYRDLTPDSRHAPSDPLNPCLYKTHQREYETFANRCPDVFGDAGRSFLCCTCCDRWHKMERIQPLSATH